jgi:hypothetical protein
VTTLRRRPEVANAVPGVHDPAIQAPDRYSTAGDVSEVALSACCSVSTPDAREPSSI